MSRLISLFLVLTLSVSVIVQTVAQTETIDGVVIDRITNEPIEDVEILIIELDKRTTTDSEGAFSFKEIAAGKYTLQVSIPRSKTDEKVSVEVEEGKTLTPVIFITRVDYQLEGIEVKTERVPKTVLKKSIESQEITRIPGTAGDVLRALPVIPGIGVANDFSGALYIRGGSDEDNLYYFDRVPVGYPFHFGGLVSSLNSDIIDRIDVYAGGYGAEFGVDSQAVIDIYSKDASPENLRGKFNLNLLFSEGLLQGKIGQNGYWYAAGRRSYIDLFVSSLTFDAGAITAFPKFWDYQVKIGYDFSDKHQLFFNMFASGDNFALTLDGEDVDVDFRGDTSFESGFEGAGVHLRSSLTDRLTSYLSLTRSDFLFDVNFGPTLSLNIDAPTYTLREDLTYQLNERHRLESGLILGLEPGEVSGVFSRIPDEGEVDYDIRFVEKEVVDESVRGQRIEAYLQDRFNVLPFLSVVYGLRLDYFNRIDEISIQPRGSIRLELPNTSDLQFAYGIYNQTPIPAQLSSSIGNPELKSSQASHYILELKREISQDTEIKMAAYYKDLVNLVTSDDASIYLNQGVGYAQGTEIFLRHRSGDRFFGWVSYAYALSKRKDRLGDPYRYYSFDQTHVTTLAASYKLTPTWEIGAKWQYRTGNPYTPVTGAEQRIDPRFLENFESIDEISAVDIIENTIYIPIYGETNSERLPPYHRLDIRLSKTFIFKRWNLGIFLEVLNAYNQKNLLDYRYNTDYSDKDPINQFPLIPYLGITAEF